jgi:hypothetical protein
MRLKICIAAVCVLAIILTTPLSAFAALANSVKASDKKSVSFVGSYAENYVDGNVSFGGSGVWDSVVNSIYLEKEYLLSQ